MADHIVIGTRGSELARIQAQMVVDELRARWTDLSIETRIIKTCGDEPMPGAPSGNLRGGWKGLFTAEIERALCEGEIDLAVHSAKDLPSDSDPGVEIAAALRRGSVHDVLVAPVPRDLHSLPQSGIVATGSVRRKHQLRWKRPDLEVVDLRGNVPTRLRKLASAGWHAAILAQAGLERLGLPLGADCLRYEGNDFCLHPLSTEIFLPAGGQGIIAIQIRSDDDRARMLLEPINHFETRLCLRAEREFLRLLQADCNQPVGVLAAIEGAHLKMIGQIFALGATVPRAATVAGPNEDAESLAAELLKRINAQ
ncbi:MAG: porphobilinogen deaminase [Spartobacteria bacterium]|nr:porphobilinogen deaminase [Spartobacteria bacterium]